MLGEDPSRAAQAAGVDDGVPGVVVGDAGRRRTRRRGARRMVIGSELGAGAAGLADGAANMSSRGGSLEIGACTGWGEKKKKKKIFFFFFFLGGGG
ncbi:hypothetical protein, partial [Lysobacter capsici]|uniref:hypothetical protein n=1 Tax=Lysobacter capsici TaxID=435897 RepID=UPI00398CF186